LSNPGAVAIDGSGDAWVANHTTVSELSNSGTPVSGASGYPSGGLSGAVTVTVDESGNVWVPTGSSVVKLSHAGAVLSGTVGYTGGGLGVPANIAMDGSGNAWVFNGLGSLSTHTFTGLNVIELSSSGAILSGNNGYGYTSLTSLNQNGVNEIAVDGSGNVWLAVNGTNNSVTELIGVATPVITPICAGLPTTPTVDGSSKLGTRP
jgi:hypothetical protein